MKIPLTIPSIQQADIKKVIDVLTSGQLVQGKYVQELENMVASYIGVDHVVAVSSGTASLHLALLALGIGYGDEVIVPAFSFVATANVVELVGAKAIFADINLDDFNIDSDKIEKAITRKTKAIIPVHEFGHPANMKLILHLSKKYNIPVIEDAACALGSEYNEKKIGSIGDIGSFSLHPRKAITSGEGGFLTTNNSEYAEFFRVMRNHGMKVVKNSIDFVKAVFNYRMTDFQASLVIGQLKRIESIQNKRSEIAVKYIENLKPKHFVIPEAPKFGKASWQSFHILLNDYVKQSYFIDYLKQQGIGSTYGAQCIPIQTYYINKYKYNKIQFPNASKAYKKGIVIPLFDTMMDEQVDYVINAINNFEINK